MSKYIDFLKNCLFFFVFESLNTRAEKTSVKGVGLYTGGPTIQSKINGQTAKFVGKQNFLGTRKVLNLGLKAEKQLQNENHAEDWALGSHPRDNGHVTHQT